jgi:hypothetical protein
MEYAWDLYACKFNHVKNTLQYEKLHSKIGVICTGISQKCILVYTGTYLVDKVNGLHITHFFNFGYMIRCKVCGTCMHTYSNIRKIPSSMKIQGVIVSIYPGISCDILGSKWVSWDISGYPRIPFSSWDIQVVRFPDGSLDSESTLTRNLGIRLDSESALTYL